ncbi:MAG TPA: transketolase C-terminal domain-containing protein [Feifaniaceae bacterium]|nr:transketolase C-terminal domain-containing protein [Feifaniaceae bacterium]
MEFTKEQVQKLSQLGSRGSFGEAMMEIGAANDDVFVMTADLGDATRVSQFGRAYPEKYLNIGICEQNLVGAAAGMALGGRTVVATTFAAFAAMRACEQVRTDMGYMRANVKLIGADGGVVMGTLGNTHYAVEDIGCLRSCPYLTILSPADGVEIVKATFAAVEMQGPVYLRLTGAAGLPIVYEEDFNYEIGRAVTVKEGGDVALIATGSMVYYSLEAAKLLAKKGISARVVDMHTIKPLDEEAVRKAVKETGLIVTVEEHNILGGLGAAVAEVVAGAGNAPKLVRIGLPDSFGPIGTYQCQLKRYGLTAQDIAEKVLQGLK